MKKISISLIISILILGLILVGCSIDNSTTGETQTNSPSGNTTSIIETKPVSNTIIKDTQPTYIGNFRIQEDDNYLEVIFSLYDKNEDFMAADGYAAFEIKSKNGKSLYTENHRVLKSGFSKFTQTLTGVEFKAYSWVISKSEIEKSTDWSGTAYLQFKTDDGTEFESLDTSILGLPEYSDEEISEIANTDFQKNAINLNIKKEMDDYIAVTVNQIGLMTFTDYSGEETLIRVDITVENIGDEKISYYSPSPIILGKSNNQFEKAYVSTYDYKEVFDSGDIYPGVIKKGAIFFETEGNPKLDVNELIIETGLSSYFKDSRNIGDGQAFLYNKEYVFKYDLSDVDLK